MLIMNRPSVLVRARTLLALSVLGVLAASGTASPQGSFRSATGRTFKWQVNSHSALVWDGAAYMPIGAVSEGAPAEIVSAKKAGVTDLLVNVPLTPRGVRDAVETLEAQKLRYLLRFSSVAPQAEGFTVDPAGYRLLELDGPKVRRVSLPGADRVLAVFASRRSRQVLSSRMLPVVRDTALVEIELPAESDAILILYPQGRSQEVVDLWEGLDQHRDQLISVLNGAKLGDGARGIVDPLGQITRFPSKDLRFVPTTPMFRREFEAFLQERYRAVLTGARSWSLSSSSITNSDGRGEKQTKLGTFGQLARLVPLWSGTRGVDQFLDPETQELLPCDRNRSSYWKDLNEFVRQSAVKRFSNLVGVVKKVVDLPVIQDWKNWNPVTDGPEVALDGIGGTVVGDGPASRLESAARPLSAVRNWSEGGWLVATEVSLSSRQVAPASAAEEASGLGYRAVFLRQPIADWRPIPALDLALVQYQPGVLYFPENATNPAVSQRLSNGTLWLPTPSDGNRIDLGEKFFAYRISDRRLTGSVIWAATPGRVRLKMLKPEKATFTAVDGSDLNIKAVKGGIEVNLGQLPLVISGTDEIPIPDFAFEETFAKFQAMFQKAKGQPGETVAEAVYFRDGLSAFETNPAGAFALMRGQFLKLLRRGSDYSWIEAESSPRNNFSETGSIQSCSESGALLLNTTLSTQGGYFAEFDVSVRSTRDQEVWIAAKLPSDRWQEMSVIIGGQVLTPQGPPVSFYGNGFAWYRMGTTRLQGSKVTARIQLPGAIADAGLDVLLLSPSPFVPRGVSPPEPSMPAPTKPGGNGSNP